MPNLNSPFGLRPVGGIGGGVYSGKISQYSVPAGDATAIFVGDPVKLAGTSQFINGQVFSDVAQAATGDVIVGVVVGVLADTRDSLIYRAASTQRVLLVCDDPNALFEIQQVTGGTPLTANDVGLNANFVVGSGSTVTGQSGVTINNATEATTNTLDLKIVGMVNRADNDVGTSVSSGMDASRFLVRINRHQYVNQIAGV
jgi:hypothetical protein